MRMILAHAARGFNASHTIDSIHKLAGLNNCWFDTAAVCEPAAIVACIKQFGHEKVRAL